MIRFYDVDENYINYLQRFDSRIPNVRYSTVSKFVCGVVINIDGFNYFAPISSQTKPQRTSMLIYDRNWRAISSIKFSFMFPANFNVLTMKNFAEIKSTDPKYANLLEMEYTFCKLHEDEIHSKAQSVYAIGCNPNHRLNNICCDFKLLEEKHLLYNPETSAYRI